MEVVPVLALVEGLISVADKLLDKLPNYDERKKADYSELKANFEVYKSKPLEFQVNSYLHNLHLELLNHVKSMVDSL